ncbi:DUF4286 family protein [Lysobacter sp. SG-8]|uniref:DUF4286 family protein n=1 Tax=Marilutibacter penaei TaxID=2759900 RepID=A0A7W3U341_9GAMM|nr:DUF4286 family protein [Lysobacter penaei]MBB1087730.1 DUF4286 family protein [Lysobacter penaei]
MKPAVIYEVNLDIEAGVLEAYRHWLHTHVSEICALPGFTDAQVYEVLDPPPGAGRASLCVHYRLENAEAFQAYIRDHAPRLRAEGEARFGGRFHARRRVLLFNGDETC